MNEVESEATDNKQCRNCGQTWWECLERVGVFLACCKACDVMDGRTHR